MRKKRIRRTPVGTPTKHYFHSGTQAAIVAYQQATTRLEKEGLYNKEISPAFNKLIENLINIHKFTSLHDSFDDLKNDCVTFLFETIGKFDATRGTNAFSYFNVVAKNWLIIRTKQKNQKSRRNISIDDVEALNSADAKKVEEFAVIPSQEQQLETFVQAQSIIELLHEMRMDVKTENELLCINSIITVFDNIKNIDFLNKSSLMLYIRELSGLSPKQLTTSIQSLKRNYKKIKIDFFFDDV